MGCTARPSEYPNIGTVTAVSTTEAIDQPSQSPAQSMRSRLRRYLARRSRQFLRLMLVFVLGLVFMAGALEAWRGASLIGLPNIGDPFDVAEFRSFRIPEQDDAIVLLRQAQEKLTRMPGLPSAVLRRGPSVGWSKAAPELRDWVAANRDLLEVFRMASERKDGIPHPGFDQDLYRHYFVGEFAWLVLLEGSRLDEQGDMEGAWRWYRSLFRMKVHVMRRGSVFQRFLTDGNCSDLRPQIATWAANPRTSVPLLRQALADILAGEPKPEWDVFSLKIDYLAQMHEFDSKWGIVQQGEDEDQHWKIGGEDLPPNLAWIPYATKRYFWNEPERSRRVMRLAFANWLAHAENEDPQLQKPAVHATFRMGNRTTGVDFYSVDPKARAEARKLAPADLAKWFVGTRDAKILLSRFWPWPAIRTTERREHRALVLILADELYKRDHGKPPTSEADLIGSYLDRLPSDGSEEVADGSAEIVSDEKPAAKAE
jgi:hypothetical protein